MENILKFIIRVFGLPSLSSALQAVPASVRDLDPLGLQVWEWASVPRSQAALRLQGSLPAAPEMGVWTSVAPTQASPCQALTPPPSPGLAVATAVLEEAPTKNAALDLRSPGCPRPHPHPHPHASLASLSLPRRPTGGSDEQAAAEPAAEEARLRPRGQQAPPVAGGRGGRAERALQLPRAGE